MVCTIRDLTVVVFQHIEITSPMDVDKSIKYMQRIFRVTALNKYKQVLAGCMVFAKSLTWEHCSLVATKDVTIDRVQPKISPMISFSGMYLRSFFFVIELIPLSINK